MANQAYQGILKLLQKEGIAYAQIRDDVTAPDPIKDLDLLIDAGKTRLFRNLAEKQGFFLAKDGYLNPGKKVFIKIEGRQSYIIDLHEKIIFRGIEFLSSARLLQRRVSKNGFFKLSDEDFLLSLLFHNVLAKKEIQHKHRDILERLFAKKLDEAYLRQHLQAFGLWGIFRELRERWEIYCCDAKRVEGLSQKARAKLLRRPTNFARLECIRFRRWQVHLLGRRRGILIAFLGPDGAGKSATMNAVGRYLKDMGFNVRTVYLGPWGGSIFKFKKRLKWLNPDPYREDYKAFYAGKLKEKPGPLHGIKKLKLILRSGIYYGLLMIEMYARWWAQVLPHLRQGRIVLSDRYIYDMLVGYKSRPMDYQKGIRKFLCDLFPKPDFGILLHAQPEVIFSRKPQLNQKHLELIYPAYHEVASQYGFITLDTSENIATTICEFSTKVTPKLMRKLSLKLKI